MESIDPWGQRRDDWRAALLAHTIVRCHAAEQEDKIFAGDAETKEFLLSFEPRDETDDWQTAEQQLAILTRWAQVHNARLKQQGSFA